MYRKLIYSVCFVLLAGQGLYGSLQPEIISYDDSNPIRMDINQNALFAVRFTPIQPFNLTTIYVMFRNDYNTTDGADVWVAQNKGGIPQWPAIAVGRIPPPLTNRTWLRFDLAGPMYFDGDFFIIVRQKGGPSPGPGFWIGIDYGTTTYRTVKSYDSGQGWLDEPTGDTLIRAGGMYVTVQPTEPVGDYGDAPDPGFPTLYATQSTAYPGRRGPYHLDVTREWIGTAALSATTTETRALVVDSDFDDGTIFVRRAVVGGVPTQIGFVTVPVTVAAGTSADMRYLNVLVDFNRDGRWAAYNYGGSTSQEEWIAKNIALMFPDTKNFVNVNVPFVWLDPNIRIGSPIWLRATLTTETVDPSIFGNGNPGWDGSGPNAGFARGETEDHLVYPATFAFHPVPPGRKPIGPIPLPPPIGPGPGGGPGVTYGPEPGAGVGAEPINKAKKHPVPDIAQEPNECGPTSAANSLYYLGAAYGFSEKLPGSPDNPRELIELLKKKMNWTLRDGVTDANFIAGKLTIAEALDLPIITKYMDDGICQIPDANWILAELKRCEDVELGLTFDDPNGGGHWVTATGYVRYPNGDIVIEVHDPDDGLDGEDTFRLGKRDGYPSLLDYPRLNRIDIVVSESPVCAKEAGCFPSNHPDYTAWIAAGRPDCWCCPKQCHGDSNCDGYVDDIELSLIGALIGARQPDPIYNPCFDFNHNLQIDASDLNIVLIWYEQGQIPACW